MKFFPLVKFLPAIQHFYCRPQESTVQTFGFFPRILKSMIVKTPNNLKENSFLLVFNNLDEIIGIALSHINAKNIQSLKPKDTIAINLSDKGFYLRKNQ